MNVAAHVLGVAIVPRHVDGMHLEEVFEDGKVKVLALRHEDVQLAVSLGISDAKAAVIRDFCIAKAGDIRTPKEFDQFVKDNTTSITSEVRRVVVGMAPPIRAYINTRQELKQWAGPAIDDMNAQLDELMPQGAVARYGLSRLQHVPRYMEAIDQRLEAMELDPDRDADRQEIVERVNKALATRLDQLQRGRAASSAVKDIRFQIQELRVSLFAERLGTAQRVSEQRILKAIKGLR